MRIRRSYNSNKENKDKVGVSWLEYMGVDKIPRLFLM